jgi:hypothetical protein
MADQNAKNSKFMIAGDLFNANGITADPAKTLTDCRGGRI